MDSSDEDDLIIIVGGIVVKELLEEEEKKRKKRPSIRVNSYLKHRKTKGRFAVDFNDMITNGKSFQENFHMKNVEFHKLFDILEPFLQPQVHSRPDDEISPKEKLAIVVEYFASGSIQRHMASIYRISKQHFGKILDDVCTAICIALKEEIAELSTTKLVSIANDFNAKWNFPNCLGAVDGKHVALKCPPNSGSLFYNYKQFHSIVLMAIADANYKFTYLDIGAHGSEGDATVFGTCNFGKAVLQDELPFPEDGNVLSTKLPFFFVGDDAFPLHKRLMKPYVPRKPIQLTDAERIFNYRLSRARRVVENAFGILCSKWLCLRREMFCGPTRAQKIISACCYLHNYLLTASRDSYCPSKYADYYVDGKLVEGAWRSSIGENSMFCNEMRLNSGRQNNIAKNIREQLKHFVNSPEGSLEWQRRAVFLDN